MENKIIKLDIGSGRAKFEDYITVDNDPSVGADLCIDIEDFTIDRLFGFKVIGTNNKEGAEDINAMIGKIDEIRAHHILEHLRPENKVKVMALFFKLLKPGGILDIEVPLFPHPASIQDPTHISFWVRESFWYFIKDNKFGEAFAKRYSQYPVPLFEFISQLERGGENDNQAWAYQIILKKPL